MSTVIKAGQAGPILRQLSTVDLADHLAEADAVVEQAKRQASQIVSKAEREMELALKETTKAGYETGHAQGYEQGTASGHEAAYQESVERFNRRHADITAAMQQAVEEFEAMKEEIRIAAERDVLEFAVQVASKLTFAIGRLHRESAVENLARALRLTGSKTDLTVRVHPDDAESIRTFAQSVLQQVEVAKGVKVVEDVSLSPGGCKVSSERTDVDAALETQVDELVALLLGEKTDDA